MNCIERDICKFIPGDKEIVFYWLGGAGFIIKSNKLAIGIDLYLSDAVRNSNDDYKRIILPPVLPKNLTLDILIASHEHGDHMDTGSINNIVRNDNGTILLGPDSVIQLASELGVPSERMITFNRKDTYTVKECIMRAVPADHGDLSPQAIGIIITLQGINILFTGDTCFRTDYDEMIGLREKVDVLIVPINPAYGNPGPSGAAYIASIVHADTVLPCHYWLFKEHGGDPGAFLESCQRIAKTSKPQILAIGERFIYKQQG
jgi:L-ascorbate 6-phosphate lactonase